MSALYGRLTADEGRTKATRCAHRSLVTTAETWQGILRVELEKDGLFSVSVSDKNRDHRREIARGNLDRLEVWTHAETTETI